MVNMPIIFLCMKLPLPTEKVQIPEHGHWRCFAVWSGAICRPNTHRSSTHNLCSRQKQPATVATVHGDFTPSPLLLCLHLAFLHILWARVPVFWSSDANSRLTGKVPEAGKIEGRRRRACQRMRWLDGITDAMDMNLRRLQEMARDGRPGVLQSMGSQSWTTELGGNHNSNQCRFLPPLWNHFSSAASPVSVARICSMRTSILHSVL